MKRNPSTPPWARTMLEKFSVGELQAGKPITRPMKMRDGTISMMTKRNKGTGIPASTWKKMKEGTIQPGPKTLAKLSKFKERYQYNKLRTSGVPLKEAKKLSRAEFSIAMNQSAQYLKRAEKLAKILSKVQKRTVKMEWILYHMMEGDRDFEDWDNYITALEG